MPGGKLGAGETPEQTLVRELKEELGFRVKLKDIISASIYKIKGSKHEKYGVLVICYHCELINKTGKFELVGEAGKSEFKKFSINKITGLKMPKFYKEAILKVRKFPK